MARGYDYGFTILKIKKNFEVNSNSFEQMIALKLCHIVLLISNARSNLYVTI